MSLNSKIRNLNKEIEKTKIHYNADDDVVINVKADCDEQIFSTYSYDNKTALNADLSNYLWENAKASPQFKDIKLNIYCKEHIEKSDVECAIKSHYKRAYDEIKFELKRTNLFSFICLILGLLSLTALFFTYKLYDNFILTSIIDIFAWVFVWEATDKFCFERTTLKLKSLTVLRLYYAEIFIKSNDSNNTNNIQTSTKE